MPIPVYFKVRDGKGKTATFSIHVGNDWPAGTIAESFAPEIIPLLQACIKGQIVQVYILEDYDFDTLQSLASPETLKEFPALTSDVEEKVELTFHAEEDHPFIVSIPTISETLFLPGSNELDISHPDVAALISIILDGVDSGTGTYIRPVTRRGGFIDNLRVWTAKFVARKA